MDQINSIYSKQHPKIRQIFNSAPSLQKVLCVAMDYSKASHEVLFCNGYGDILKKSFVVKNSPDGIAKLLEQIKKTCEHRSIKKRHVFLGGEDTPLYVLNFHAALKKEGYLVAYVNAWTASKQKENHQASTDRIDVLAIAKALLHNASYCHHSQDSIYRALRETSRTRSYFVEQFTAAKLQIHHYVSLLFPGFLNENSSGLPPFSKASQELMSLNFSSTQIAQRQLSTLEKLLDKHGCENAQATALKLKALARVVLPPPADMCPIWQRSLAQYVEHYRHLEKSTKTLEKELAHILIKTPAASLTSIKGVGILIASGIVSEMGDPLHWKGLRHISSYAGIVPRVEQTGGPEKASHTGSVKKRCNRRAKHWVVLAGSKMGECGPEELQREHQRLKSNDQHADFIMARRLLRIGKDIVRRATVYRPKELLNEDTDRQTLLLYYHSLWGQLVEKWRSLLSLDELCNPQYPLGQWRQMVQEMYKISLAIPKQRTAEAN